MNEIAWLEWLTLNATPLLLAGCFILLLLNLWRSRRPGRVSRDAVIESLQRDLRALTSAAVGMGERVLEVERRQRRLAEKQESLDLFDSANQPYEQAIRLARQGASADDLVQRCGLATSEAELIALMHRLSGNGNEAGMDAAGARPGTGTGRRRDATTGVAVS